MTQDSKDVLIVDDHDLMGNALCALLAQIRPEWCSQQFRSGQDVLDYLGTDSHVKLIILDLFMPGVNGFDLIGEIAIRYPHISLITISASKDPKHVAQAMQLGSQAYVPKASPSEQIADAIQKVLDGEKYLPADISLDLESEQEFHNQPYEIETALDDIRNKLTERQLQIFFLLGQGKSNKEIARDLFISTNTVKIHVSAILKALSLNNRAQTGIVSKMIQETENRNHTVF